MTTKKVCDICNKPFGKGDKENYNCQAKKKGLLKKPIVLYFMFASPSEELSELGQGKNGKDVCRNCFHKTIKEFAANLVVESL